MPKVEEAKARLNLFIFLYARRNGILLDYGLGLQSVDVGVYVLLLHRSRLHFN